MNMQMGKKGSESEKQERGTLPLQPAKQKARLIFIVQLRNITAAMLGPQPFRVVWSPAFMSLHVVLLGKSLK